MNDTPDHIKQKQLEIWLAKSPGERLMLTLKMNDDLYGFWNKGKKNIAAAKMQSDTQAPVPTNTTTADD